MGDIVNNNNGVCDLKCKYTFNYKDSSTSIIASPINLSFTYESFNPEPVTYNSKKYQVSTISIYTPSVNSYNGKKADAEIIIIHLAPTGGYLLVSIPIMKSNTVNKSSLFFSKIIDYAYFNKNTIKNNYVKIQDKINLNDIIPMKKYYADTSNEGIDVIVFSIDDNSYINMTTSSYDKLIQLIRPHKFSVTKSDPNNLLYVNLGGPSTSDNTDSNIYIDCKPVSEDGKLIGESKTNTSSMLDNTKLDKIIKSTWFKILIPSLFLILILFFIIKLMNNFNIKDALLAVREKVNSNKVVPIVAPLAVAPLAVAPTVAPTVATPPVAPTVVAAPIVGGKSIINAMKKNK